MIDVSRFVAFDTETHLAQPGNGAPPIVCGSTASMTTDGLIVGELLDKAAALAKLRYLMRPGIIVVGANIAYDMAVGITNGAITVQEAFDKYDRGEIFDVLIAQALDGIALGMLGKDPRDGKPMRDPSSGKTKSYYSLAICTDQVLGRSDAKDHDYWRLRYAILENVPLAEWPTDARQYPVDDAVNTLQVALAQCGARARGDGNAREGHNLHAMADITRAAWALHLGALFGFAVDTKSVTELMARTQEAIDAGAAQFVASGLVRGDGTKNTATIKRLVAAAYGADAVCGDCGGSGKSTSPKTGKPINCRTCDGTGYFLGGGTIPLTETGLVSTARDVLADSGNSTLEDFGEWGESAKIVSTYGPALLQGLPLIPNVPLANERVSYAGIVQLMPRGGGVRECVRAREGRVLSSNDFAGIEMVTWAQVCINLFGFSDLADAINSGADAHSMLGADLCGRTYEEFLALRKTGDKAINNYRQAAKAGNFTFAGMGGPVAFVKAKRKEPGMTTTAPDGTIYKGTRFCLLVGGAERCGEVIVYSYKDRPTGVPLCAKCIECAEEIRSAWRRRWTEANRYYEHVARVVDTEMRITHFESGIVRDVESVTVAANGYFSSLAAVGAKRAFYNVQRECFDQKSTLWGSRAVAFIHDEAVCSHPQDVAHEAATRAAEIMRAAMQSIVPDVKVGVEPALMLRLYKGAEPVYVDGRLVPWEPKGK